MVVMYLMTSLPPLPIVHLDDEKDVRAQKHKVSLPEELPRAERLKVYGAALVPAFEALVIFKEQFANSQDVLTVPAPLRCLLSPLPTCAAPPASPTHPRPSSSPRLSSPADGPRRSS